MFDLTRQHNFGDLAGRASVLGGSFLIMAIIRKDLMMQRRSDHYSIIALERLNQLAVPTNQMVLYPLSRLPEYSV